MEYYITLQKYKQSTQLLLLIMLVLILNIGAFITAMTFYSIFVDWNINFFAIDIVKLFATAHIFS